MANSDYDDLFAQAGDIFKLLVPLFKDLTGEELDIESALRNYPWLILGAAAGAGLLAGIWIGRKQAPAPPPPPAISSGPMAYLERLFPQGIERVRQALPEGVTDEAAAAARTWMDT